MHNMEEECSLFLFLVLVAYCFYDFKRIVADTDCNRLHFEGHSTAPVCSDSASVSRFCFCLT